MPGAARPDPHWAGVHHPLASAVPSGLKKACLSLPSSAGRAHRTPRCASQPARNPASCADRRSTAAWQCATTSRPSLRSCHAAWLDAADRPHASALPRNHNDRRSCQCATAAADVVADAVAISRPAAVVGQCPPCAASGCDRQTTAHTHTHTPFVLLFIPCPIELISYCAQSLHIGHSACFVIIVLVSSIVGAGSQPLAGADRQQSPIYVHATTAAPS